MTDTAAKLVNLMTGENPGNSSFLLTDGYKFSMAQAGFPLREETFYLSCRSGGPFYVPFDLGAIAQQLTRTELPDYQAVYLDSRGYGLTPAMRAAREMPCTFWAPPVGSWVGNKEPLLTVTGSSFMASWLEPLAIMLHFPLQVATAMTQGVRQFTATCDTEAEIIGLVYEALGLREQLHVTVRTGDYQAAVRKRALAVRDALGGDASRAFEVGLRAATCLHMHRIAMKEIQEAGIQSTSNVYLAMLLGMLPVGTTGHEHQNRWLVDLAGFRAIRDMRPQPPSYLFDTYDAMKYGIPDVLQVLREAPGRKAFTRFDSGDQAEQLRTFVAAKADVGYIFEDGYTAGRTVENEALCDSLGIPRERRAYGYGGHLVLADPDICFYDRNKVSAIYKLSQTGTMPVMKFSVPSKSTVPGKPRILRDAVGRSMIAQQGEAPADGWAPIAPGSKPVGVATMSPETAFLYSECRSRMEDM